jgi:hypothetical protein
MALDTRGKSRGTDAPPGKRRLGTSHEALDKYYSHNGQGYITQKIQREEDKHVLVGGRGMLLHAVRVAAVWWCWGRAVILINDAIRGRPQHFPHLLLPSHDGRSRFRGVAV